ncbi:MAG: hypothetical protein WAL77_07465 [Candidatus Dormiibacterota bacterium]
MATTVKRWVIVGFVASAATVVIVACGGSPPSAISSASSAGGAAANSSASAAAAELVAASAYSTAFNAMVTAVNAQIAEQNKASTDPTGAAAAINAQISARQTFDTAVQAITFPPADAADVQAVLSADAALENVMGTLAANTDNISNYNAIFNTVTPAQSALTAADASLSGELGLSG